MIASSTRSRARLVAASVLLIAIAGGSGLSACSAGQITQTSSQVPAVPGANANAGPNGEIALRDLVVAYNDSRGYPPGGSAPLVVRIFNSGHTPVTLVGVSAATAAASVSLVGGPASAGPAPPSPAPPSPAPPSPAPPSPAPPSPAPATSPAAEPEPSPSAGASPTAGPTAAPTAPAPPSPTGGGGTASLSMPIAPSSYLLLVPGQGPYLQLTGLKQALAPGSSVLVTFSFAGGTSVAVTVPFGLPTAPVPRTSADVPDEATE